MSHASDSSKAQVNTFDEFAQLADYSLMDNLRPDPEATLDGDDRRARQVYSGHFVPLKPTAIAEPEYVSHSRTFFNELGLSDELVHMDEFRQLFSGDISVARPPMRNLGWAPLRSSRSKGRDTRRVLQARTGLGRGSSQTLDMFVSASFLV